MVILPADLIAESNGSLSPALEAILDRVPGLPPATQILPKLLTALCDADTSIDQIAELIAFDPGLTLKLIQLCNSAALGGTRRVSHVAEAINRLGVNCVFQLVAGLTGNSVWKSEAVTAVLDVDRLWEHSVTVALAAGILAKDKDEDESAAFISGLLHESGKIVMAQASRENYEQLLARHADAPDELVSEEREAYGFDHAQAGGRLLSRDAFPDVIVASITYQYRPTEAHGHVRAAALLTLANTLAGWTRGAATATAGVEPAHTEALRILDLAPQILPFYRERIEEEFKFANALCHL